MSNLRVWFAWGKGWLFACRGVQSARCRGRISPYPFPCPSLLFPSLSPSLSPSPLSPSPLSPSPLSPSPLSPSPLSPSQFCRASLELYDLTYGRISLISQFFARAYL